MLEIGEEDERKVWCVKVIKIVLRKISEKDSVVS